MLKVRQQRQNVPADGNRPVQRIIDIGWGGVLACIVVPPLLVMAAMWNRGRDHAEIRSLPATVQASEPAPSARGTVVHHPRTSVGTGYPRSYENESVYSTQELQDTLDELLPLFVLPDGKPLDNPGILYTKQCMDHVAGLYIGNLIELCKSVEQYPPARRIRVIKHELVHAWIAQSGIKDNSSHGSEFMKKAIEVGTLPVDEQ